MTIEVRFVCERWWRKVGQDRGKVVVFGVKLRYCGQILIFSGFGCANDNRSHVRTECGGNPKTLSVELTDKLHEIDRQIS